MEDMERKSNCKIIADLAVQRLTRLIVNASELERLKKRFMKLDRLVWHVGLFIPTLTRIRLSSNGSGSIDREEFLQIPQIANNPLANRMIAIFDEECVNLTFRTRI